MTPDWGCFWQLAPGTTGLGLVRGKDCCASQGGGRGVGVNHGMVGETLGESFFLVKVFVGSVGVGWG